MTKNHPGEQWKTIKFGFDFTITNDIRVEVSNYGRLRSFHKKSDGEILKGSMINGYPILRLRLFKPRDEAVQKRLDYLQQQVDTLSQKIKEQKAGGVAAELIAETTAMRDTLRKNLSQKYKEDAKERCVYFSALVHRLVADYFLGKPGPEQTIVAHLDHDKLNNRSVNLRWMTPAENIAHQQKSPHVIKDKENRLYRRSSENRGPVKLSVTRVMLLKKLLNQGKPMKQLVKQFKVTETQILRIKRGENWADIQAAE